MVPLPKANQLDHLRDDLDVFDFELTDVQMRRLEERDEHYSALGASFH